MLKKVMITAAVGAAIVGGGTAALAASGSTATPAANSSTAKPTTGTHTGTHTKGKHDRRVHLGRALHGSWVTKDGKTNAYITHDAIHGTVSAVSATSISIKAADGVSETYQVTSSTKVRMRTAGQKKGATGAIGQVKTGSKVIVIGTGKGTLTATRVVAGLKR